MTDFGRKYDGLYVACVTPYKPNGLEVDELALREFLRYFLQPKFTQAGGAIIINPEAGEIFVLNKEERIRNVRIAVEECKGKVPVFAGAFGITVDEAVQCAKDAKKEGADGIFWLPPQGTMEVTTDWDADKYPDVWIDHMKEVVKAADLPLIVHAAGGRWLMSGYVGYLGIGGPSPTATRKIVTEVPNIIGWKMIYQWEAYRMIARMFKSLDRELGRHVGIFGAGTGNFHAALAEGLFDGTSTGGWNYALEPMLEHILAWREGNVSKAREIWDSGLFDLHLYVNQDRSHIRYKIATWLHGLIPNPYMRPPMPKPKKEEILKLKDALTKTKISVISDAKIREVTNQLQD